jgi:hypothetical protein
LKKLSAANATLQFNTIFHWVSVNTVRILAASNTQKVIRLNLGKSLYGRREKRSVAKLLGTDDGDIRSMCNTVHI